MSWDGYFTLDGAEFINVDRFRAYAGSAPWFTNAFPTSSLSWALDETYVDPETDLAPWYDTDVPVSGDFWGFYPTSIDGIESSSRSASTVESTGDGGVPGRIRHAIKSATFAGFLAGSSEQAVEYGMKWLRRTLLGGLCSPQDARKQALGADLVYLGAEPHETLELAPADAIEFLTRRLRRTAVTVGPLRDQARILSCGDVIWMVSFTISAGDPRTYGADKNIFVDYVPETVEDFWSADATEGTATDLYTYVEDPCTQPVYAPLYDPECASVILPPTAPNVPFGCWVPPEPDDEWDRVAITIPEQNFPTWTEMMPLITLTSSVETIRDIRIRFYRDEGEDLDPESDPCSWLTDMVVSYIPPTSTMAIDASFEDVHVTTSSGVPRRGDSLVFSSDMRPVTWPVLECGVQHIMTIESRGSDFPVIDLTLVPRNV
jgi:hypothetical protein